MSATCCWQVSQKVHGDVQRHRQTGGSQLVEPRQHCCFGETLSQAAAAGAQTKLLPHLA